MPFSNILVPLSCSTQMENNNIFFFPSVDLKRSYKKQLEIVHHCIHFVYMKKHQRVTGFVLSTLGISCTLANFKA